MKNTILVVVLIVAVVVILVVVGGRSDNGDGIPTASPSESAMVSASPQTSANPHASVAPTLSYEEASKKYAGTRIQFDARCQAIPNYITIKKGTAIMLDNRSGDARTVSVGTVKYSLAGYGFRIVTPSSATLPATLLIDCGSAQNVGQILIQK